MKALILSLLLVLPTTATASEPALDEGGVKLELKAIPDIASGKARILSATTNAKGDSFFVEHLTMFQPAMVVLIAKDPDNPLRLELSKYRFDKPDWSENTDKSGVVSRQFRTQGELKIRVTPRNTSPGNTAAYSLIVWAADLPKPNLDPPVSSGGSEFDTDSNWAVYLGGLLALVAVAALFFRLGRKS